MTSDTLKLGLIAAGGVLLVLAVQRALQGGAGSAAAAVGQAAGQAIGEGAAGVVVGIGTTVGIPATSMTRCEQALAQNNGWDASFYCPAGTWIKYMTGTLDTSKLPPIDTPFDPGNAPAGSTDGW